MKAAHTSSIALILSLLAAACDEEIVQAPAGLPDPQANKQSARAALENNKPAESPPAVEFQEAEFTESERSRDPFRSFAGSFAEEARTKVKSQREVLLDQYTVDELRLVGIVTRVVPERALLIDPTGKGHIIQRGQFVGRAEIVQGGGSGADYEINWRVERIRDTDIVLVRDDPSNPDVPSATRIVPLRPESAEVQPAAMR